LVFDTKRLLFLDPASSRQHFFSLLHIAIPRVQEENPINYLKRKGIIKNFMYGTGKEKQVDSSVITK